jgi:hypothetical protein
MFGSGEKNARRRPSQAELRFGAGAQDESAAAPGLISDGLMC